LNVKRESRRNPIVAKSKTDAIIGYFKMVEVYTTHKKSSRMDLLQY
jgi:hypothetical protein